MNDNLYIVQYRRKYNKPFHHLAGFDSLSEAINYAKEVVTTGKVMVVNTNNWRVEWCN